VMGAFTVTSVTTLAATPSIRLASRGDNLEGKKPIFQACLLA